MKIRSDSGGVGTSGVIPGVQSLDAIRRGLVALTVVPIQDLEVDHKTTGCVSVLWP